MPRDDDQDVAARHRATTRMLAGGVERTWRKRFERRSEARSQVVPARDDSRGIVAARRELARAVPPDRQATEGFKD